MQHDISTPRLLHPKLLWLAMALSLFEGIDVAAMGLTLSNLSRKLALSATEAGYCASASLFGLLIGATVGGRLSDRIGRRAILAISVTLLGVFTIATAFAWNFEALLIIRFLAGLGMGGLVPLLIMLARDAAALTFQATAIGLASMCQPIGAIVVSVIAILFAWEWVYYIGGLGPLLLLPVLFHRSVGVATTAGAVPETPQSMTSVLFGGGRAAGTLMLWGISFIAALVTYFFLNWLPSLLEAQGFSPRSGRIAFLIYCVGGVAGVLLAGQVIDRIGGLAACVFFPMSAIVGVAALAFVPPGIETYFVVLWMAVTGTATSFTTFALAPDYYSASGRSTGVGTMVSVGRAGGVTSPLLVGVLLDAGVAASQVFLILIPFLAVAIALGWGFATRRSTALQGKEKDRGATQTASVIQRT